MINSQAVAITIMDRINEEKPDETGKVLGIIAEEIDKAQTAALEQARAAQEQAVGQNIVGRAAIWDKLSG